MRALLFAPAFAPHMGSESLTASKLVVALRRSGWDVDVISRGDVDLYGNSWEPPWLELRDCSTLLNTRHPGRSRVLLERVTDAIRLRHPIHGLRWAAIALSLGRRMLRERAYDVLLSRSPPEVAHLPALVLSKESGLPWIANWNDPPMGSWPAPYQVQNGPLLRQWIYRRYTRDVYRRASINTFPSEELARHVQRHFSLPPTAKSAIIPHATLPLAARPAPERDRFLLRHAGKLCGARSPRSLFAGIRMFVATERPQKSEFLLEQIGHADEDLVALSREYGIQEFVYASGSLPYLATMERLAQSCVNLLIEAPCSEGIFLPGKFTDYAEAGRPILAVSPRTGTVARLLAQHGGGIHADVTAPEEIANALSAMYRCWRRNRLDLAFSSPTLAVPYQAPAIVQAYQELFERIAPSKIWHTTQADGVAERRGQV